MVGFLRYHSFNRRMLVYDDGRHLVADMYLRDREFLDEGDQLDFEHHLVSIEDFTGSVNQDLTPIFSPAVQRKKAAAASPAHTPVPDRQRPPAYTPVPDRRRPPAYTPVLDRQRPPTAIARNGMPNSHIPRERLPQNRQPQTPVPVQGLNRGMSVSHMDTPNSMWGPARPPIIYPAQRQEQAIPRQNWVESLAQNQAQARPVSELKAPNARPVGRTTPPANRRPPPQDGGGPSVLHPPQAQPRPGTAMQKRELVNRPDMAPESAPEPVVGAASALSKIRQFSAPARGRPPRQSAVPPPPPPRPATSTVANSPLGRDNGFHQVSRSPSPGRAKQQASRQVGHQQVSRSISIRDSRTPSPPLRPRQRVSNPAQLIFHQRPSSPSPPPSRRVPAPQKNPNKRNLPTTPAAPPPAPKRQQAAINRGHFRSARAFNESSQADELEEAEDDEEGPPRGFGPAVPTATLKLGAGRKKTLLCSRPPNFRFPEPGTESSRRQPTGPRARPETAVDELSDGWDGYNE